MGWPDRTRRLNEIAGDEQMAIEETALGSGSHSQAPRADVDVPAGKVTTETNENHARPCLAVRGQAVDATARAMSLTMTSAAPLYFSALFSIALALFCLRFGRSAPFSDE